MPYSMHRIFCATPGNLEDERQAFYSVVGCFNENEAMKHDILFVPVSIVPNMVDLNLFQNVIDENVRSCRYYIQVLGDTWGAFPRNFERYFELAKTCAAAADLPMREVAALIKPLPARLTAEGARSLEFHDLESYRLHLRALLSGWLERASAGA